MRTLRRAAIGTAAAAAAIILGAGPALADHCTNASKPAGSGIQVLLDAEFENVLWLSDGVQQRIDAGIINPDDGTGFTGLLGVDLDGDLAADISIWVFDDNPWGAIPEPALANGAECHGVMDVGEYFEKCF
jgi:hypothetical protein